MSTVEELVLKAKPEGIGDVESGFNDASEAVADTAGEMEDTGGILEALNRQFSGAMGAIVAGLAVATGALLSQVPVVGELVSGLTAVVEALGLRLDKTLRPALTPITDALFGLSEAILSVDGPLGTLLDGFLTAIVVVGTLSAVLFAAVKAGAALAGGFAAIKAAAITVGSALATLAGVLSLPVVAIGLLIAALIGLGLYFREDIVDAVDTAIDKFVSFANTVGNILQIVGTILKRKISDFVSTAKTIGTAIVNAIANKIRSTADRIREAVRSVIGGVADIVPGININDGGGGGVSDAGAGGGFRANRGGGATINMDGRDVTENTGRFRLDETTRRGL